MASSASAEEAWKGKILQYMHSGKDSVSILTCGNAGAGKSSLVNGLIGEEVTKEDLSPNAVTTTTQAFEKVIVPQVSEPERSITVKVWDTPGFGAVPDLNPNMAADEAIIKEKAREADLVLYCMDMRQRLSIEGIGVVKLTELCGREVWQNAVIALTFANMIEPNPGSGKDRVEYFTKLVSDWKRAIAELLEKKNVQPDLIKAIPIIPTGYRRAPPPDCLDWLSSFWEQAFDRTKAEAQPSLLSMNINRLRVVTEQTQPRERAGSLDKKLENHEQPINLTPEFIAGKGRHTRAKTAEVMGTAGAGGAVAGAGIGALIGCIFGAAGGPFAPITMPIAVGAGALTGAALVGLSLGGLAGVIQRHSPP